MGMTAGIYRASEAEIRKLADDPGCVAEFLDSTGWAPPVREVRPKGLLGWLWKLSPITIEEVDPDAVPPPDYELTERAHCDLEGGWTGLHFLFTGKAREGDEPACYLVRGGEDIGDADELGYSRLQALDPERVRLCATFRLSLSNQQLEDRYAPQRMMALRIDAARVAREQLFDAFDDLRAFIDAAVDAGDGVVVYLT